MNDFSRFEQIFGIDSSNKKQKSPATPVPKSRKRKSLPQLIRSPALPNRKFRVETPTQKNQKPVIVSPDKREILLHLSCNEEDFQNVSVSDSDDSDGFENVIFSKKTMQALQPDVYSPNIEEFSESEDIFHISQESTSIVIINNGIVESLQRKPKYRPMNKVPKPGGLLERLRAQKSKRIKEACTFTTSNILKTNQRKIQVIQHCNFRRQLFLSFKFIDEFAVDENQHYMVLPLDFSRFVSQHPTYDVIFDLPAQEFMPLHFVHFGRKIKAARQF